MKTHSEHRGYVFTIEQLEDGTFDVDFPDIPGIITGGDTEEEAFHNAREAVELHLDSLLDLGKPLPKRTRKLAMVEA